MRPFHAAIVAASFLFFAVAAAAFADTAGLVRGTVTFGGAPAAAVAVSLRGEGGARATTTDAAGKFVFARVPFGHYTLTAVRSGTPPSCNPSTSRATPS